MWTKLLTLAALTLSATLCLATLSWAQAQVPGPDQRGRGYQGYYQGGGPGSAYCQNYPGYRNCPQGGYGRGYGKGMSPSPRRNWQAPPTTPQNPPEVLQ